MFINYYYLCNGLSLVAAGYYCIFDYFYCMRPIQYITLYAFGFLFMCMIVCCVCVMLASIQFIDFGDWTGKKSLKKEITIHTYAGYKKKPDTQ